MSELPDGRRTIAVVGAGMVGVATALWLLRAGHEVVLVDRKGPAEGASYGNAGILASSSVVPVTVPGLVKKAPRMLFDPNQPLFLKWQYLPRLLPWLRLYLQHCHPDQTARIAAAMAPIVGDSLAEHQALAAGTGAEPWIVPCDYLYVYPDRAAFAGDAFGWGLRAAHGVTWDEMETERFHNYEPAIARDQGFAVLLPGHGRISDPGRYIKALAQYAEAAGARQLLADVEDVARENGAVTGVRVRANGTSETLPCDAVVVAAGAWSAPLAAKLGVQVPLESERGYHLELWEPTIVPRSPMMIASGKFVVTPMEGRLRLAGIVEFGGLEAPASKAPIELLMRQVKALLPGLSWRGTEDWMGHRPAPTDSIPLIGAVPGIAGAYLGFGHHHVGLTGGPKTGRLLAQLISGQKPNIDLAPYAPARFQG